MWLRILGLPMSRPAWWQTTGGPPADGTELEQLLRQHFPGLVFRCDTTSTGTVAGLGTQDLAGRTMITLVARPAGADSSVRGPGHGPEVALCTVDGPDSGRIVPLSRHGLTIGRSRAQVSLADPFLSSPHLCAAVGPDGVTLHRLRGAPVAGAPQRPGPAQHWDGLDPVTAGTSRLRLFRGRPGPLSPVQSAPGLCVDPGPPPARPHLALQVVMALSPLAIGVVMMVVTGLWYFLLFSLVSVLVAVVLWRQHRSARTAHGRLISDLVDDLAERLEAAAPGPGALALAARADHPDRFGVTPPAGRTPDSPVVRWGTAEASIPVQGQRPGQDWDRWAHTRLPAVSTLAAGGRTAVTGDPSTCAALLRWLLVQLCRDAAASGRSVVLGRPDGSTEVLHRGHHDGGTLVSLAASPKAAVPDTWHRMQFTGWGDRCSSGSGPTSNEADVVDLERGTARIGGVEHRALRWTGVSAPTAAWLTNEFGLGHRPEGSSPEDRPGDTPTPSLLPQPTAAPERRAVDRLPVALSGAPDPTVVDLVADGPHLLITGSTGSGKSELLLTLLVGLAAAHPPSEVSLILMDFKGGSSFAALARLPHTMSVETNLVEAESLRTLDALTAELRRREELFLDVSVPDYATYRRTCPDRALPRLVVAVDELRVLVDEHPQAATVLIRLAATGRSLGFHLVLATQRAQGAVGPDIRSNLGSVIALRTASEQESWEVLGNAAAARISAATPGRAILKRGSEEPTVFQTGRFAAVDVPSGLRPWRPGQAPAPSETAGWPEVVDHLSRLCSAPGLITPPPVVVPGLPETWNPHGDERCLTQPGIPVALLDEPAQHRQQPMAWHPFDDGPCAWIGTAAGGIDDAARTLMGALRSRRGGDHTVVLDGSGCLSTDGQLGSWELGAHLTVHTAASGGAESVGTVVDQVESLLADGHRVQLVITSWGRWAGHRVGSAFETFEERLTLLLRDTPAARLSAAVFGGRELAAGRVLGQIPTRFYVPAGTTPEHRMVWPRLTAVREIPGRAVLVSAGHPAPGLAAQLADCSSE